MNESLGHIEQVLGSQRALSLEWLVPLTLVYVLIFILGVVGNVATILVICKFRYMQTLTNLYLCNLAITDLLTLTAGEYRTYSRRVQSTVIMSMRRLASTMF